MKTTVIGCGSWGARVARKLVELGERVVLVDADPVRVRQVAAELECEWSADPVGYLSVTGTQASSTVGGSVVIATPPAERVEIVRAVLDGYGVKPVRIRIEKPLACSAGDARVITRMCEQAGVELSVGFTLLHHPLYLAAFGLMRGARIQSITALRVGAAPAGYAGDSLLDLGIHAASVAAFVGVHPDAVSISTGYVAGADARITRFYTSRGEFEVDEVAGRLVTPRGVVHLRAEADPLRVELEAWRSGTHAGTAPVAMLAQEILESVPAGLRREAVAA